MQTVVFSIKRTQPPFRGPNEIFFLADLATGRDHQLTTGKRAERTKHDFRCPICRSAIGQTSCSICPLRRQLTFPFCVVPLFELPIENNKHPNFEWRQQRRGVDSFVLWGYRLWVHCLNNFVADCRYFHYQMSWNCYSFKFICQDFSEEDEWCNKSHE